MPTPTDGTIEWHDDGHQLCLQIVRSELVISTVLCPHAGEEEAPCRVRQAPCVVTYFIERYGLECNVGVCVPAEYVDIAWSLEGDPDDIDAEAQVWVIPTTDDFFASWRGTQV